MAIKSLGWLKQGLVDEGVITDEQLSIAEATGQAENQHLSKMLVKLKFVTEEQLANFIGEKIHIPYIDINNYAIDRKALELIPEKIARRYGIIPLFKLEDVLTIAMSDPADIISIDDISKVSGSKVEPVVASGVSIDAAIDKWYGVGDSRKLLIQELANAVQIPVVQEEDQKDYGYQISVEQLKKQASEAPIIQLVNGFIAQAILEGASDIHFQPKKTFLQVRFRIDGFLYDRGSLPSTISSQIISRIKIMSKLDISKKRIPQDGRISLVLRNRNIDIRCSTLPTMYGENIVLRILDKGKSVLSFSELGLSHKNIHIFERLLTVPKGIFIATGPTGCGKSTTLYSFIAGLDRNVKNVMTIEDPIEYEIDRVVQSNIDNKAGLGFADALRAILRQDPDIIYVGEMRDFETANIAVSAALTGHFVITTLHTNDAVGVVMRLREMGIRGDLIASVLTCCVSQRLVRRLCPKCKKEYQPDESSLAGFGVSSGGIFYKAEGCEFCNGIGYKGRISIFEILTISEPIARLIAKEASEDEIRESAKKHGMITLIEDGMAKIKQGVTSLEELKRVTLKLT